MAEAAGRGRAVLTPDEIERLALERGGKVTRVNGLDTRPCPRCKTPLAVPTTWTQSQCPACGLEFQFEARTDEDRRLDEKAFDAALVKLAKRNGWETYHTHDSRRSRAGWPDRAFWRERFLLAELKAEDGRLTQEQTETITTLRNAGVEVYVWRPSQWQEIEKVLA